MAFSVRVSAETPSPQRCDPDRNAGSGKLVGRVTEPQWGEDPKNPSASIDHKGLFPSHRLLRHRPEPGGDPLRTGYGLDGLVPEQDHQMTHQSYASNPQEME